MIYLAICIAIGAAFSSFWIKLWGAGVAQVKTWLGSKD